MVNPCSCVRAGRARRAEGRRRGASRRVYAERSAERTRRGSRDAAYDGVACALADEQDDVGLSECDGVNPCSCFAARVLSELDALERERKAHVPQPPKEITPSSRPRPRSS